MMPRAMIYTFNLTNLFIETASSGRAICKATECKSNGIKIEKDDLRLGSWVTYEDRGSWAWKHW